MSSLRPCVPPRGYPRAPVDPRSVKESDLPSNIIRHNGPNRILQFVSGNMYESALIDVRAHRYVGSVHTESGRYFGDVQNLREYLARRDDHREEQWKGWPNFDTIESRFWNINIKVPVYTIPGARNRFVGMALRDSPVDPLGFDEEGFLSQTVMHKGPASFRWQRPRMRLFDAGMFCPPAWKGSDGTEETFTSQRHEFEWSDVPIDKRYYTLPSKLFGPFDGKEMSWRIEKNCIALFFTIEAGYRPKDEVHPKPWAQLRYSATMVGGKLVDVPYGLGKPYLKYNSFHDDFMEASMFTSMLMLDHQRRLLFHMPLIDWELKTVSNEAREAAAKRLKVEKDKLRARNAKRVSLRQKPLSDSAVLKKLYGYTG